MDPPHVDPFVMDPFSLDSSGMNPFAFEGSIPSLRDVSFTERWDLVRTTIERLYLTEKRKLSDVVRIMKDQYHFDAAEHQYKHQFKKWKLKKSIPTVKKASISEFIQSRTQLGSSVVIQYKGQEVEAKKMQRYLKMEARRDVGLRKIMPAGRDTTTLSTLGPRLGHMVFLSWNLPYRALRSSTAGAVDHLSPFAAISTPSDVVVASPGTGAAGSPPSNAFSSTSLVMRTKAANDRARLFVEGRHDDLLRSMGKQDRRVLSTWLYQFWIFSFKTAKHWGRGPRDWKASILQHEKYEDLPTLSLPNTPGVNAGTPNSHGTPRDPRINERIPVDYIPSPSPLCRWSIHTGYIPYEKIKSPPPSPPSNVDPEDEGTWADWPVDNLCTDFVAKLKIGLETNDFSNVRVKDLPMALTQIVRAVRRSPVELLLEAFGFSIMSGNSELMWDLIEEMQDTEVDISGLHPLHLAASYLRGSKCCCLVFDNVVLHTPSRKNTIRQLYVNDLGHTVLDSLMMSILKSHTSCLPGIVDDAFRKDKRFVGEEVDICGRWDADSDCVRALLAHGIPDIPFDWKHMFCHTSVQAICHCISAMFGPVWSPDINTPSGLFLKRCVHCGLKLQLLPLHTLVLTTLHLARCGCAGETLFGMLACLLCLLSNGANPLLKADVSLPALLGTQWADKCGHEDLDPMELAEKVPNEFIATWSSDVKVGWQVFWLVLRLAQEEWTPQATRRHPHSNAEGQHEAFADFMDIDEGEMVIDSIESVSEMDVEDIGTNRDMPADCEYVEWHNNFFGTNRDLATLWAAIQIELLTYRRLEEGGPWTSSNFSMQAVLEGLSSREGIPIGLVEKSMMKQFCDCGKFLEASDEACVRVEEASAEYFSNLEDWNRSQFIVTPEDRLEMWF